MQTVAAATVVTIQPARFKKHPKYPHTKTSRNDRIACFIFCPPHTIGIGIKVPKDKIHNTACPAPAKSEGDGSTLVFLPGVV